MKSNKKFSLGVKIASILSCVAVLSVGFASWLIVNIPTETNNTVGSFEVYTVVDESVTLTYDWGDDGEDDFQKNGENYVTDPSGNKVYTTVATEKAKITFGKPSDADNSGWLRAGDDVDPEKLTAKVEVTISNFAKLTGFTASITASAFSGLTGSSTSGDTSDDLLVTPTVRYLTSTGTNADGDDSGSLDADELASVNGVVVVEFVFAWGAAFGGNNPYTYYNGQTYSAELGTQANKNLTDIQEALASAKYSVTFTCE